MGRHAASVLDWASRLAGSFEDQVWSLGSEKQMFGAE